MFPGQQPGLQPTTPNPAFPQALPAGMPTGPQPSSETEPAPKLPNPEARIRSEVAGPDMMPIPIDRIEDPDGLAGELSDHVQSWTGYISNLWPRWDANERLMINQAENPKELPWDGAVYRHIPVTSSKMNGWLSFVCQPPTSTTPYLVSTIFGKDASRAKSVEQDMYLFFRKGEFNKWFRLITYETGLYGKGIWRVYLDHDEWDQPYFHFEDIPARQWVMYPNVTEMLDAEMIGHMYEIPVGEVDRMQDEGEMYGGGGPVPAEEGGITGHGSQPFDMGGGIGEFRLEGASYTSNEPAGGRLNNASTIAKERVNKPAKLVECFIKRRFKGDSKLKWYLCRFAYEERKLLGVYEYHLSRPWYFDQYVHQEPQRFWPETSRANDLQPLQLAENDAFNQTMWGLQMAWDPAMFSVGWAMDKKYSKMKPGTMTPMLQGGTVSQVQSQAHVAEGIGMMNKIEEMSDKSIRFGDQQLGAEVSSQTKATVADIQSRSASFAAADDLATIDICMNRMGRFCQELYRKHYPEFYEAYRDDLATQPDEGTLERGYPTILGKAMEWELLGKTPQNSPMSQSQAIMQLAQGILPMVAPPALMGLDAVGINASELVQSYVMNSGLNDRDVILNKMDEAQRDAKLQQYIQQFQQAQAQHGKEDPQLIQAKVQEMGVRTELAKAKAQQEMAKAGQDGGQSRGEAYMKMLDELIKIYNNPKCPPDIMRQIERIAGLQPSQVHPVANAALSSGALHESLLNPPLPATNGQAKKG